MGCGCAKQRRTQCDIIHPINLNSNNAISSRSTYDKQKRTQILRYLQQISLGKNATKINELADNLSYDCQGLSLTLEKSEIEMINSCSDSIISLCSSISLLVKTTFDFINENVFFY